MSYLTEGFINHIIKRYKIRMSPEVFIETGTYKGISMANVSKKFRLVHTIELSENLYKKAVDKFKDRKNIVFHCGDSAETLKKILPSIDEPVVFWLDAHYSAGETVRGHEEIPLLRELEAIVSSGRKHVDIIIIDDLPYIGKKGTIINKEDPNYPKITYYDWRDITVEKIVDIIKQQNRYYYYEPLWGTLVILTHQNIMKSSLLNVKRFIKEHISWIKGRLGR